MKEELHDAGAVAVQVALEPLDGFVSPPPDVAVPHFCLGKPFGTEDLRVDAGDQNLLVIGAVEDPDPPALGERARRPPEEIVLELLGARVLETEDLTALWIDPRHHVRDGAVLAGRVHGLKDQQQRVLIRGVEEVLQLAQLRHLVREERLVRLLRSIERLD